VEVKLPPEVQEELAGLPFTINARIRKIFVRLRDWPNVSGAKALKGDLKGQYRVRTGDYRVQFYPSVDGIIVTRVGHREGFYDE